MNNLTIVNRLGFPGEIKRYEFLLQLAPEGSQYLFELVKGHFLIDFLQTDTFVSLTGNIDQLFHLYDRFPLFPEIKVRPFNRL